MLEFLNQKNNHQVFSNRKIKVILSPHYDDFILSLGGLAHLWSRSGAKIEDVIIFSLTNYLNHNSNDKNDSPQEIAKISDTRHQEEIKATANLGKIQISRWNFYDASIRNKTMAIGEFRLVDFSDQDEEIIKKIIDKLNFWCRQPVEIFVPLAIGFHPDHILVREAVGRILAIEKNITADIFFYEDLPYAHTHKNSWPLISEFIKKNKLIPLTYPIDLPRKLKLIKFYPSQSNKNFYTGIMMRSFKLAITSWLFRPSERIYNHPSKK